MDDLHDARHGPLFMLYLKKLDWTACRKVQVRHGRHDMEGLRLITCFCQLSWKPRVNERSGRGIEDQHGVDLQGPSQTFHRAMVSMTNLGLGTFGLTSFQNTFSIMSLHKAQHWLNPPKVCKSNLHTALSHFSLKPVRNLGAYLGPNSCPFKLSGSPGRQTHR